jgi:hypothetical protein
VIGFAPGDGMDSRLRPAEGEEKEKILPVFAAWYWANTGVFICRIQLSGVRRQELLAFGKRSRTTTSAPFIS